jgi:hypothetical protein
LELFFGLHTGKLVLNLIVGLNGPQISSMNFINEK